MLDQDAKEARRLFSYDKKTGILRWKVSHGRWLQFPAGVEVGRRKKPNGQGGYVFFKKKLFPTARIIWLIVKGKWPEHQIDHKDRDPRNNRWKNLREASSSENKANCRKYKRNKPGRCHCEFKGVMAVQKRHSIRYRAGITKDGKRMNLGSFDTAEQAHAAYMKAALALFGEFASSGKEPDNG